MYRGHRGPRYRRRGRAFTQSPRAEPRTGGGGGSPPAPDTFAGGGVSLVCVHKQHTPAPSVLRKAAGLPRPALPCLGTLFKSLLGRARRPGFPVCKRPDKAERSLTSLTETSGRRRPRRPRRSGQAQPGHVAPRAAWNPRLPQEEAPAVGGQADHAQQRWAESSGGHSALPATRDPPLSCCDCFHRGKNT